MCGFIASFGLQVKKSNFSKSLQHLKRRGPDSEGVWFEGKTFLASRRLAIFDLNKRSDQPLQSLCSRYQIIFNGSIYNFKSLRNYLINKKISLKTNSDTEVILELYVLEGPKMIHKLKGMFAFIIWDNKKKEAFVTRDPYGIKPLYIGKNSRGLVVSSQVKSILLTNLISKERDLKAHYAFWKFGYVIEPRTWFRDIKALKPGNYIKIKNGKIIQEKRWYNLNKNWLEADKKKPKVLKYEYKRFIKKSLIESINRHLVSDVPAGIFLSSGVDSTLVASVVSSKSKKKITAITVVFEDFKNSDYDETLEAKKIAKKLGLKHHIFKVTKKDFIKDLPKILDAMDQPSMDGINTWYASKAAAKLKLKVVFSGIGGDEIFFGYNHFKSIPVIFNLNKIVRRIPFITKLLNLIVKILGLITKDKRWDYVFKNSNSIFKLWLLKRTIRTDRDLISNNIITNSLPLIFSKKFIKKFEKYKFNNSKIKISKIETIYYLRNQLLRDSDWASMYHGIELRTPLVDVSLLENLSKVMQFYSEEKNKNFLKSFFKEKFTQNKIFSKKVGFQTPVTKWIKKDVDNENNLNDNKWSNYMEIVNNSFNKL